MVFAPPVRHLLRAKDLADARYFEPLGVDDLARRAGLDPVRDPVLRALRARAGVLDQRRVRLEHCQLRVLNAAET